jgi:hypothetical protein
VLPGLAIEPGPALGAPTGGFWPPCIVGRGTGVWKLIGYSYIVGFTGIIRRFNINVGAAFLRTVSRGCGTSQEVS